MSLSAKNITVSFPGVVALENVSVEFFPNRVHAVLGANGSGKSTLVKVLTGVYHPDKNKSSVICIDETETADFPNPSVAHDFGIRVVHQETPLVNDFTVAECVALIKGYHTNRFGGIDWPAINQYVDKLFEVYNITIDPQTITGDLKAADRNMIAMAIAIGIDDELAATKALILDEADASVPEADAENFLHHVKRIAEMGIPVIMVTHRLKEVRGYCDDVTILNGGKLVFTGKMDEIDEDYIIKAMANELKIVDDSAEKRKTSVKLTDIWQMLGKVPPVRSDKPVLEMKNVFAKNINGLSFTLGCNEILGFVGIPDSGICELPELLGGDIELISGVYEVCSQETPRKTSPGKLFKMGVSVLPADRPKRGGIMDATLYENFILPNENQYWHKYKLAKNVIEASEKVFDIQPSGRMHMDFGKFSGGNQQKAILGKWLADCPRVLVMDDPTYGVDPNSRLRVFDAIHKASEQNIGVIMFSTEPEQLSNICTRIIVLRGGKIKTELKLEDGTLTRESVARWCYA